MNGDDLAVAWNPGRKILWLGTKFGTVGVKVNPFFHPSVNGASANRLLLNGIGKIGGDCLLFLCLVIGDSTT